MQFILLRSSFGVFVDDALDAKPEIDLLNVFSNNLVCARVYFVTTRMTRLTRHSTVPEN